MPAGLLPGCVPVPVLPRHLNTSRRASLFRIHNIPPPLLPLRPPGRGTSEGAAPAERHYSLTGQHGVWARARRVLTPDFWFDRLDEMFEAGDNVDLTVSSESLVWSSACPVVSSACPVWEQRLRQ